jgi:beta-N-acetylhexosaminidase
MNTPEPFSQNWGRQQPEKDTPYPSHITFPPQVAQDRGYPPQQGAMPGVNGSPRNLTPPWDKFAGSQSANREEPSPLPPLSTPLPGPTSPPSSWNGSDQPRTAGLNSGYLPPSNSFTASPPTTNSWNNQWTNTAGSANGSNGFVPPNTPIPPTNPKLPRRDTSRIGKILLFFGLALLLVTAGTAGVYLFSGSVSTSQSATNKPTVQPTPTPTVHVQHQQMAAQYVANMSLDDEIAQLIMVEHNPPGYTPDLDIMINQQHVGSVIMYATSIVTRTQVQNDTSQMQAHAKIPVFISIDEEGRSLHRLANLYNGNWNYRKDADDIQATGDANVATTEGTNVAKDLLSLGMNMNLAPDIDISSSKDYIGYDGRSFGTTSDQVIKYASPYLKAMQANGVVGSIKHFPGLGSIPRSFDPHATLPTYTGTKDQLYQNDLVPFKYFIQSTDQYEQAQLVMPTDMLVPAIDPTNPVELSKTFITDILRNELGFKGVILTDSLHMGGVSINGRLLSLADASVMALQVGNDILEGASTSTDVQNIVDAVKAAVQNGTLTKAQIDASVTRVLTLKMDFNVMPATSPSSVTPVPSATSTPAQG